jgi:peptide/nickel transport system ATP-binding protein
LIVSIPRLGAKFTQGKKSLLEIPGIVTHLIRLPAGSLFAPRCDRVIDQCRKERPPLFVLGKDHGARCWMSEREAKS